MENKSVCYYCGTIYDDELGKCPLCGSTMKAAQEEIRPAPRRRLSEEERRQKQRSSSGKYSSRKHESKKSRKGNSPLLIAALIFLILSVLVVFYFIGDMIGWWPGLENAVDRGTVGEEVDRSCTALELEPESLTLAQTGDTAQLTVSVNAFCEDVLQCSSSDESIVTVSEEAVTSNGDEMKSATFVLTAVAEGEAQINVTCGTMTASCIVICGEAQPTESTEPPTVGEDFVPELNYPSDVGFGARGESVQLTVNNLPQGMKVTWRSEDESVAKVDEYGEVTAIGGGQTNVIAEVAGKTAQVLVRCNFDNFIDEGAHLAAGRSDVTVKVGEKFDLFLYDSESNHITDITYTIDNPAICKVEDGYVIALSRGTTTVTVTYFTQTFECIVRVK